MDEVVVQSETEWEALLEELGVPISVQRYQRWLGTPDVFNSEEARQQQIFGGRSET